MWWPYRRLYRCMPCVRTTQKELYQIFPLIGLRFGHISDALNSGSTYARSNRKLEQLDTFAATADGSILFQGLSITALSNY